MPKTVSKKSTAAISTDPYEIIREGVAALIQKSVSKAFGQKTTITITSISTPPNPEMGDLAFGCFVLAKELSRAPHEIAKEIATQGEKLLSVPEASIISSIKAEGPYVNIRLNPKGLAGLILPMIGKKSYGTSHDGKDTTAVVEYVSPNTNKPLHVGHIRNGALGASISSLLTATGYKVKKVLLVNDRGVHICKSMVAYQQDNKNAKTAETPESAGKKGDHLVGDYYVKFETYSKEDETIKDRAQQCLLDWEAGDKSTRALWKKMNSWVLKGHDETYKTLGLKFDKTYYESDIYLEGKDVITKAAKKGLLTTDESGAVIADLSEYNLPNKVLLRSDGTSIYITQDIYLALQKEKEFGAKKSIYVVGSEQEMYFKQLFATLAILKQNKQGTLYHLSYGMVNLPEGRMKSREGTVVDADDLLSELEELIKSEIISRDAKLSAKEVAKRAHAIAIAAVKYYMLEVNPKAPMTYNPKESIALQGRTGPYLLYTYARLKSILRKGGAVKKTLTKYDWASEAPLLLLLAQYPSIVKKAAHEYAPAELAKYLYELAKSATDFYHHHQVLTDDATTRAARLTIIASVAGTLQKGLSLLGIETLEQM